MSELKRELNLKDAISIVAGSMIGSGIFIVSTHIARQENSSILLIITWLIAGLITLFGALCYGELSSKIPDEGGQYIYLKNIFSKKLAFLYGWTLFFVIQTGTLAAVNIAMTKFLGLIFPILSSNNIIFQCGHYTLSNQQIFAVISVLFLTFINSRGVKAGILIQNIFTITKIISIILIIITGLFFGFNLDIVASNFSIANNDMAFNFETVKKVTISIVGALFASITWNNVTFIASEIKNPKENIKKALSIGVLLVISLYFLLNMIYLISLPIELIKTSPEEIVVAQMVNYIFSQKALYIIAIIISISAFGCANGMILTGSRIYYKMAKDRIFFRKLAYINRRTKVPANSLWLQCFWICVLILWGNYAKLLDYVIYSSMIFYVITILGIFKMRKMYPETKNCYTVPDFIPVTFSILSIFLIVMLSFYKPFYTIPGLFITLLGIPVYNMWQKNIKLN